jgi:hypothetical protein
MPTFVDREVSRGQRGGSPAVVNLSFLDRTSLFLYPSILFGGFEIAALSVCLSVCLCNFRLFFRPLRRRI